MWMCVKKAMEGLSRGVGQDAVINMYTNIYSTLLYRFRGEQLKDFSCNRLQEVIHCSSSKLQPLELQPLVLIGDQNARVRRDTGSWRGVLVRQEEETLHRNVGRVLG